VCAIRNISIWKETEFYAKNTYWAFSKKNPKSTKIELFGKKLKIFGILIHTLFGHTNSEFNIGLGFA
jgi:hypothetical protein